MTEDKYDSAEDTIEHINNVRDNLSQIITEIKNRLAKHDATKLQQPEKDIFDVVTPKLKGLTYGSDEYNKQLKEMKVALDHHYKNNRHHPEYYENGIGDMTLVDIIEMFCDWAAATHRHNDGDIGRSINHNAERFGYSSELGKIFVNTAREFGLGKNSEKSEWKEGDK